MTHEDRKRRGIKITVAIVEDDRDVRENWAKLLDAHPRLRCVATCESGETALRIIPEAEPDVVLMDINLPGMSGIRCTAMLKNCLPKTHILMVTVYSDNDSIYEALKCGASGYLLKSAASEDLIGSIIEVVEGGAPMTGQIARRVIDAFRKPESAGVESAQLTSREKEILHLLAKGYANKEIAAHLGTSAGTVRVQVQHIYEKLHVHSRTEAAAKYLVGAERGPI